MLFRSESRNEALQSEMTSNAKNYAKEVANLKMDIAEKEAQLEALTIDV